MDTLANALEIVSQGYPVFRVRLCANRCLKCNVCKAPVCPHGFRDASADRRFWKHYPGGLIGVPTGEVSDVDVLDVDSAKNQKRFRGG